MSEYAISTIYPGDRMSMKQVDALLLQEGITRDANLDYICGMYDEDYNIIATGSCFGSTLRCFAVDQSHQGEGLLNEIISHLIQFQYERGNFHLFLYTKINTARFFNDLGFYEIARVNDKLVFMENRKDGFSAYLRKLQKESEGFAPADNAAAIVMNANPFTLGHLHLVRQAATSHQLLHVFMVSEDASLVPYAVRKRLIMEGCSEFSNIVFHDSGPYIISSATFPSYFLKDAADVIESHARLDIAVFARIAEALSIRTRYVGEEPTSLVTGSYNLVMTQELPATGCSCVVIPRLTDGKAPISASTVRTMIQTGQFDALKVLVPESTLKFFMSEEAIPVIESIRSAGDVVHY